jgi:hypothetical protein
MRRENWKLNKNFSETSYKEENCKAGVGNVCVCGHNINDYRFF